MADDGAAVKRFTDAELDSLAAEPSVPDTELHEHLERAVADLKQRPWFESARRFCELTRIVWASYYAGRLSSSQQVHGAEAFCLLMEEGLRAMESVSVA